MTRAELAKIFNEVDSTFADTEIYNTVLADIEKDLAEAKTSREIILFNGAFELSKRFMFEVMSKAICEDAGDKP